MAFTIAASVGTSMAAATGNSTQGHLVYAANQAAYWLLYLTSTQSLSALYSTNGGSSWSAPSGSPFSLGDIHQSKGQDFGFAYANRSSTDVLHGSLGYWHTSGNNNQSTHARWTLGTTWTNTNAEAVVFSNSGVDSDTHTGGNACVLDSTGRPIDATSLGTANSSDGLAAVASNTDSGSSWTAGYGTPSAIWSASADVNSTALFSLGSGNMLFLCDNGATTGHWTNLEYSKYTGSWSTASTALSSAVTSTTPEAWGACQLSNGNVVVMAPSNNSNTYVVRSYNGTSWSSLTAPANLTYGTNGGISLVPDGSGNMWAAVIDSSKNIQYNQWNGSSWGGWTVLEATRTNTPAYITGCYNGSNQIMWAWTESTGTNYNIIGSTLNTSGGATYVPGPFPGFPPALLAA